MIIVLNNSVKSAYYKSNDIEFSTNDRVIFDKIRSVHERYTKGDVSESLLNEWVKYIATFGKEGLDIPHEKIEYEFSKSVECILPSDNSIQIPSNIGFQHLHFSKNEWCLKDTDIPIPANLLRLIEEDERYVNFWKWAIHNPSEKSRDKVVDAVLDYKIDVLKSGLMLMYRRVNTPDPKIAKDIFDAYRTKINQKKSTTVLDETHWCIKDKYDAIEMSSNHDSRVKYYLNVEARMPYDLVDNSDDPCSTGFHCGGKDFIYSGVGNTPIAVLVNPMDFVHTFKNDSHKTRTCAFTPIYIFNTDAEWKDLSLIDLDRVSEVNHKKQLKRLNELISKGEYPKLLRPESYKSFSLSLENV